jgi:hypothetical protein
MNSNSQVAAPKANEAYRKSPNQVEALLETAFPQAARASAEKPVTQTREYERSDRALEWRLWQSLLMRRARTLKR